MTNQTNLLCAGLYITLILSANVSYATNKCTNDPDTNSTMCLSMIEFAGTSKVSLDVIDRNNDNNVLHHVSYVDSTPTSIHIAEPGSTKLVINKAPTGQKFLYVAFLATVNPFKNDSTKRYHELFVYKGNANCLDWQNNQHSTCNWQLLDNGAYSNVGGYDIAVSTRGIPYIAFDSADSNNRGIRLASYRSEVSWSYDINKLPGQPNFPSDPSSINLTLTERAESDQLKLDYPDLATVNYIDNGTPKTIVNNAFNPLKGLNWKQIK